MPVPRKLCAQTSPGKPARLRAALNHLQGVGPVHRAAAQPVDPPLCASRGKQGAFRVGRQARALDVFIRPGLRHMVRGNDQILAALLVQPEVGPLALGVIVGHPHRQGGADARKAVHHQPYQRAVPQPDER